MRQNMCLRMPCFLMLTLYAAAVGIFAGCTGNRAPLSGNYHALVTAQGESIQVTLELLADGKGFWSLETDNAPFRWDISGNTIRLHTRAGGIMEGRVSGTDIDIDFPGMGTIRFQRAP